MSRRAGARLGLGASGLALLASVGRLGAADILPPCDVSKTGDDVCADFCERRCSFYNRTAGDKGRPQTLTLYRLTPMNVTGLRNKNSGDPLGDIGYWLTKKNTTAMCDRDPQAFGCLGNGPKLYGKFTVEVDGQFGPYTQCNPIQLGGDDPIFEPVWKDERNFVCGVDCLFPTDTGCHSPDPSPFKNESDGDFGAQCRCNRTVRELHSVGRAMPGFLQEGDAAGGVPEEWGPQCQNGYTQLDGRCLHGRVYQTVTGWSLDSGLALACDTCRSDPACAGWTTYDNRTFSLLKGWVRPSWRRKPGLCLSAWAATNPWDKMKSWFGVGRLGGHWYTTPARGECPPGKPLGTNGCTWREISSVYKNASCVDGRVDASVEAASASCFNRCPLPLNRTSNCYLECYRDSLMGNAATNTSRVPRDRIVQPWLGAFTESDPSRGGCPEVTPDQCDGEQCDPLLPPAPPLARAPDAGESAMLVV